MGGTWGRASKSGSIPLALIDTLPPVSQVRQQIDKGLSLMRAHLPGADYYSIIERDPAILFMPELEAGCLNFRELWSAEDPKTPLDEEALALSSPKMLALAIRALSIKGLPKSI